MKKIVRIVMFVILLTVGPASVFFLLPTYVDYRIVERYAFSGPPDVPVRLALMVPKSGPYQRVEIVRVDWPGGEMRNAYAEVEMLMLEGRTGSDGIVEATLTYDVALLQGRAAWDAAVADETLAPRYEIESDAPAIAAQAEELSSGDPRESAYRIYAFTAEHLTWPTGSRIGGNQSALTAYESRIGVCGEFANLMTALSRAAGVPARSISGLAFPVLMPPFTTQTRTGMHPAGAHAWVEVHTGDRWELADPSWASTLPFDRLWFGRAFGHHLSYGAQGQHDHIYMGMVEWAEAGGELIVAMSAPLKFAAAARGEGVVVVPTVSLTKTRDARWIGAVGLYLVLFVGMILLERRLKRSPRMSARA